ncbi:hypothetical protein MY04_3603 [Flammeovirga sp. MY04]|uniref:VIT domain-containing protein n=1 Tax=Flammeovirga sp. MY04 TaxID=1191459 RepID=UPI0008060C9E|nr:VIT domain-containing protein [Flammeovirga sp. MY04]ANQ50951.1 hypothetical protein MY04_3603 [Flammeovirga sp. MY04]
MKYKLLLLFLTVSCVINAQVINILNPRSDEDSIALKQLCVHVEILDNIATTTMEMHFYNYGNRIMEGELNFPLKQGATVSAFSLEINGEWREGVVIKKDKAKKVFEEIVRQNVDPAILEKTVGNNFKTRLYPIPPKGYKKCIITFEEELSQLNNKYNYQLPLSFQSKLEELKVDVEIINESVTKNILDPDGLQLDIKRVNKSVVAKLEGKDLFLKSKLSLNLPADNDHKEVLAVKGTITDDHFFYLNTIPEIKQNPKKQPSSIMIYWDVSSVFDDRIIDKELDLLKAYFKWNKNIQVNVKTFNYKVKDQKKFTIRDGNVESLINYLSQLEYDGGSKIDASIIQSVSEDECWLFSNGISNLSEAELISLEKPLFTVSSSQKINGNYLSAVANQNNGGFINLNQLSLDQAVTRLSTSLVRYLNVEVLEGEVEDVYPSKPITFDTHLSIAGKLKSSQAKIRVNVGTAQEILYSKEIVLEATDKHYATVERLWCQKQIDELSTMPERNKDRITDLALKYGLVSDYTSFIVLDNVEDYVRYEIDPPASLSKEYDRLMALGKEKKSKNYKERLDRVYSEFQKDIEWWNNVKDMSGYVPPKKEIKKVTNIDVVEEEVELEEVVYYDMAESAPAEFESESDIDSWGRAESDSWGGQADMKRQAPKKKKKVTSRLVPYDSGAEYLVQLKEVDKKEQWSKYLQLKKEYQFSPSFYYDVASYFFETDRKDKGVQVISNLAELDLERHELLRNLGRKLQSFHQFDESEYIFHKLIELRPFEPQNYRDLALMYEDKGDYQKALDQLYFIIENEWDADVNARFGNIELIILHEMNRLITLYKDQLDISNIDSRFIYSMPLDIRVVIDWDLLDTDIDLWVIDPLEEKCFYSHKNTKIGGRMSQDFTRGYGPEEFRLKYGYNGDFIIKVHYFGNNKQSLFGPVSLRTLVYSNYASEGEDKQELNLQLQGVGKQVYEVGTVNYKSSN